MFDDDLLEAIDDLATSTGPYTVTRTATGTFTDGVYTAGATSTFQIVAAVEPATGEARVIGGANLTANVDGQKSTEVRVLYTRTQLFEVSPTTAPDVIAMDGANWTVARVEMWPLNDAVHYRVIITKQTLGAS